MRIGKKVAKIVDNNKNQFTFKLYPPLRNATKGVIVIEGGNVLEDRTKLEASLKPRHSCTYVLKSFHQCSKKGKRRRPFLWLLWKVPTVTKAKPWNMD
jgi:hypothetical protein